MSFAYYVSCVFVFPLYRPKIALLLGAFRLAVLNRDMALASLTKCARPVAAEISPIEKRIVKLCVFIHCFSNFRLPSQAESFHFKTLALQNSHSILCSAHVTDVDFRIVRSSFELDVVESQISELFVDHFD